MKGINVLVVDDEKSLRDFIQRNLEIRGYKVKTAGNGLEALAIFKNEYIDLVILDVMMPNMDGLETIKRIREKSTVPVIVLSALGEEQDKVRALNLGADDYLSKPFGVKELLARVKAVQRRTQWGQSIKNEERLVYNDISLDVDGHILEVRGKQIELTPTEFNLLVLMMRNIGKVLSHEMILQNVWGPEYGQESEYLRVYIGRLRQKIEIDPSNPIYIHTEHGIGYHFEAR
jgi:two-component system KDP operon response regulator KdpE